MPSKKTRKDLEVLNKELGKLRARSFSEISQLPDYSELPEASTDKKHKIAVWKDSLSEDKIRVVLQSYRRHFLGIGTVYAEGFIFNADGKVTSVEKDKLWSFM